MFMTALLEFVRAGIYGGTERTQQEKACLQEGRRILMEAKTRSDQEQPKRNLFKSVILRARRGRYPRTSSWWGDRNW